MKSIIITLVLAILGSIHGFSQTNKKYEDAMKRNLTIMDTAHTSSTLQMLANSFERIGYAEKGKWLPFYYAAYTTSIVSYMEQDKNQVDGILDKAQGFIDRADSLQPNNSEIYTVKAMVLSARIMVNPMTRGAQYGSLSSTQLEKAIELDPANPRPFLQKGTAAFYTPPAFGGGKDKAAPLFEMALEKFKTFKPADELSPNWGEQRTENLLEQCK